MKKSFSTRVTAIFLILCSPVFSEKIAVEISADQPSAITTLNGKESKFDLPIILFVEKDKEYQFDIKGEKGFSFESGAMVSSRSEKLKIRLGYEPYVIGKGFCSWSLLLPGICGIATGEHIVAGSLILSSVAGLYAIVFEVLQPAAFAAKADYNALPAGTSQADFDSHIKKANDRNTNFGITLALVALWHVIAITIDGSLWGTPIYSRDPRLPKEAPEPQAMSFKTRTIQYPGEVINYAFTAKSF